MELYSPEVRDGLVKAVGLQEPRIQVGSLADVLEAVRQDLYLRAYVQKHGPLDITEAKVTDRLVYEGGRKVLYLGSRGLGISWYSQEGRSSAHTVLPVTASQVQHEFPHLSEDTFVALLNQVLRQRLETSAEETHPSP